MPAVTTQSPDEAYELVLRRAGAIPRDAVTRRIVQEVRSGGGSWGRQEQADLLAGLTPAQSPHDSDGDGLPDAWETSHQLNPNDSADSAMPLKSGYTAIEEYANELAAEKIAESIRSGSQ